MKLVRSVLAAGLVATAPAFAGPIVGSTVNYQYYVPTASSPYFGAPNGNYVVGPGVEIAQMLFGLGAAIDISATQVVIDFDVTTQFGSAPFNGFALTDAFGTIDALNGVSIDGSTVLAGFDASRVSFTPDGLWVNWQGLNVDPSSRVVLNLDFGGGDAPEPSAPALVALALAAGAWVRRRVTPRLVRPGTGSPRSRAR